MRFECERCCYETDKITNLKNHLSRQKVCDDINECGITVNNLLKSLEKDTTDFKFKCSVCDKKFKTNSGKHKHECRCKLEKKEIEVKELKEALEAEEKEKNNLKTALEQKEKENTSFKNEFKELKELIIQKNIQQNNIAIENNVQQNNITINVLGSENLSHIKPESMLECINGHTDGIIKLIKMFFLDKNHPENCNILYHDENNYKILEINFMVYNCKIISIVRHKNICNVSFLYTFNKNV
jgi:predicted RNase H-like nuclease (RuvC/YqgF family)